MKINEILKKVVASFLLLAIMLLPTMVMAVEENNIENEDVKADEEKFELDEKEPEKEKHELEEKDDEKEKDEKENIKASDIKLLEKIKFTGKLYKTYKCGADLGTYTEQVAVVTEISHRNEGVLGLTFIKSGKILSSFGYIDVENSKVEKAGKLISFELNLSDEKEGAKLEINEKAYEINKNTTVKLVNGGIQINDEFITLKEGDIIKLVDIKGSFGLENTTNSMIERFEINGNTAFKITSNGFIVSGEVILNGEKVEGEVEVSYENEQVKMKIINAKIDGKELNTTNLKSFLSELLKKIVNFIKEAVSKLISLKK